MSFRNRPGVPLLAALRALGATGSRFADREAAAAHAGVSDAQAKQWLDTLVADGYVRVAVGGRRISLRAKGAALDRQVQLDSDSTAGPSDPVRLLRHDIRGRLNAIRLCTGAAETGTVRERAEFLEYLAREADELVRLLDLYEAANDSASAARANASSPASPQSSPGSGSV